MYYKNLNEYSLEQMKAFMDWIMSDNVVYSSVTQTYTCQCNQYAIPMQYGEILMYWWKEYGYYTEWEEDKSPLDLLT